MNQTHSTTYVVSILKTLQRKFNFIHLKILQHFRFTKIQRRFEPLLTDAQQFGNLAFKHLAKDSKKTSLITAAFFSDCTSALFIRALKWKPTNENFREICWMFFSHCCYVTDNSNSKSREKIYFLKTSFNGVPSILDSSTGHE